MANACASASRPVEAQAWPASWLASKPPAEAHPASTARAEAAQPMQAVAFVRAEAPPVARSLVAQAEARCASAPQMKAQASTRVMLALPAATKVGEDEPRAVADGLSATAAAACDSAQPQAPARAQAARPKEPVQALPVELSRRPQPTAEDPQRL